MPDPAQTSSEAVKTDLSPERLKYLEMLQSLVGRMSANSSTLKGWTVTLVVALVALAAKDASVWGLTASLIPILLFAGLDAYYLHLERGYRHLFDRAATADPSLPLFSLRPADADRGFGRWAAALGRPVVWVFYAAVLASVLVTLVVFSLTTPKLNGPATDPGKQAMNTPR